MNIHDALTKKFRIAQRKSCTHIADGGIKPIRGLNTCSCSIVPVVETGVIVEVALQVANGPS